MWALSQGCAGPGGAVFVLDGQVMAEASVELVIVGRRAAASSASGCHPIPALAALKGGPTQL